MQNAVVTGTSRGVGLEFCRQLKDKSYNVFAVCRKKSAELESLGVNILEGIDVTDEEHVENLRKQLEDQRIDLLVNNAGILTNETINDINFHQIRRQFEVNSIAPLRVSLALLDLFKRPSKIAMITSRMGSITDNTSGSRYGYRMSKTALNMASVSLAQDLKEKEIFVGIFHPGYVKTDMTDHRGLITPKESVAGLLSLIDKLQVERTGKFFHTNGEELPW